jgi:5-methylcytosine-specific restriction protein A
MRRPFKPSHPCPGCGKPCTGKQCRDCYNRARAAKPRRGLQRNWHERQRRAAVVAAWRHTEGNWCPGYQREAHAAWDLTADHIEPVASGGSESGPLVVLCRSCNGRKGARTAPKAVDLVW